MTVSLPIETADVVILSEQALFRTAPESDRRARALQAALDPSDPLDAQLLSALDRWLSGDLH